MSDPSRPPASHVFIAGLPRTGSTLTHRILNRSSSVRLAGETHFLGAPGAFGRGSGYADRFAAVGDMGSDEGLERVVAAIYEMRGKSFWSRFADGVERGELEEALRASDRTRRGLFDAVLRTYAGGRPVAGDKTPEHIHAVPTLLDWFPDARVIHTFRDPRAIYVSLRRKERPEALTPVGRLARRAGPPFELYASTSLAIRWRRVARLHRGYERRYPGRYLLLRFEDMLADPEAATHRLCSFIGIPFEEPMLEQVVHNSSYMPKQSRAGIDRSAGERWRDHLPGVTARWLVAWASPRLLEAFGYEP
jgi:hypothetical protein